MSNEETDKVMPPELDDEDIRRWFESRDPNRKKPNPFIDEDMAEKYGPKERPAQPVSSPAEDATNLPSFSQHDRHVRDVARHFFFVGAATALVVAIFLVLLL